MGVQRRNFFADRATKEAIFAGHWTSLKNKKYWVMLSLFLSEVVAAYLAAIIALSAARRGYPIEVIGLVDACATFFIIATFAAEHTGHINFFNTIAVYVGGKIPFPWYTCFVMIIATNVGWILATLTAIGLSPNGDRTLGLGTPLLDPEFSEVQGFLAECLGTCISFGITIFTLYGQDRTTLYSDITSGESKLTAAFYPFIVSAAGYAGFMTTAYISGPSLNPYRFFWPAIISGKFDAARHWFYFVGPVVGVIIVGLVYMLFLTVDECGHSSKTKLRRKLAESLKSKKKHVEDDEYVPLDGRISTKTV